MISVYKLEVNNVDTTNDYLPAALFYIDGVDLTSYSEHGRYESKETLSEKFDGQEPFSNRHYYRKQATTFLEKDFDYRR